MGCKFLRQHRPVAATAFDWLAGPRPNGLFRFLRAIGGYGRRNDHPSNVGRGTVGRGAGRPCGPQKAGHGHPSFHDRGGGRICFCGALGARRVVARLHLRVRIGNLLVNFANDPPDLGRQHCAQGSLGQRLRQQYPDNHRHQDGWPLRWRDYDHHHRLHLEFRH